MNIEDIAEVEEGDGNEEDDAERDVPVGGENNKKCPYCQKISPSPSKLKRHIIIHTKERFSCQHCPKKYSQQHHLKDHLNAIHLGNLTGVATVIKHSASEDISRSSTGSSPWSLYIKLNHSEEMIAQ